MAKLPKIFSRWKNHYKDLYTPCYHPTNDDEFKTFVENSLSEYYLETHQCTDDPLDVPFEVDEVIKVVQHFPSRKAGGLD